MKVKILALIMILITSCAPKIKNFDLYQRQFLPKSEFLPTVDQVEGRAVKIAVFPLDNNEIEVAKQAKIGASLANNIENILSKNRLAKLVDRKASLKLKKEIQLAEMNKTGSYKGPQTADFAISGVLSDASFTKKYRSASSYFDASSKSFVSIPASFKYRAKISGSLKIYELPSMTVRDNIEFSGIATRAENVQQNGGFTLGALNIGGKQAKGATRDDGLVRRAGLDAISNIEVEIKNSLAQRGYVLERRTLKKKDIFKVSLGSKNGLKHGDKFEIIAQYEIENPITLKSEVERRVIASGRVSDKINPRSSWVVLKDNKNASKIRIGDIVKMKYKRNGLDSLARKTAKFIQ